MFHTRRTGAALAGPLAAALGFGAALTGTGAAAAVAPPLTAPAADWPGYHGDAGRTGHSPGTPPLGRLHAAWSTRLDAAVYASPLVVRGIAIVATERNTIYGLDLATGKLRWRSGLGAPVPASALPCGNIDPLGITGTPAADVATGRVFVVTVSRVAGVVRHTLLGLDVDTGRVRIRRGVDPPRQPSGVLNQRGALAVSRGRVYVAYGGLAGDCGDYHGHVVGVRTDGSGPLLSYRVPTPREGGIWAPSGIAVDAAGSLYVVVGNGAVGQDAGQRTAPYDASDSVTKLSPDLRRTDLFAPTSWRQENSEDADLGSSGPLLVGSGADGLVWAQGKASTGYVLRQSRLGGIGGQAGTVTGCARQFGGAAAHGYVVFAACTDGVRQVLLSRDGRARAGWQAPRRVDGSPVVGGGAVFALATGEGALYALDERTGRVRGRVGVGPVTRFATPALSGGLALVPTETGVSAVAVR